MLNADSPSFLPNTQNFNSNEKSLPPKIHSKDDNENSNVENLLLLKQNFESFRFCNDDSINSVEPSLVNTNNKALLLLSSLSSSLSPAISGAEVGTAVPEEIGKRCHRGFSSPIPWGSTKLSKRGKQLLRQVQSQASSVSGLSMQYYKTRICPLHFSAVCKKGNSCTYAHDPSELNIAPNLYKTKLCERWQKALCNDQNCR